MNMRINHGSAARFKPYVFNFRSPMFGFHIWKTISPEVRSESMRAPSRRTPAMLDRKNMSSDCPSPVKPHIRPASCGHGIEAKREELVPVIRYDVMVVKRGVWRSGKRGKREPTAGTQGDSVGHHFARLSRSRTSSPKCMRDFSPLKQRSKLERAPGP